MTRLTRKNGELNQNVLTISAEYGLVSQEEFFNKRVASKNLSSYFLLERGEFVYSKSSTKDYPVGATKRLDAHDKGVVSPLYICFALTDPEVVTSDYIAHLFESGALDGQIRLIAKEGARAHGLLNVKPSEFFEVVATLPLLSEQRKIAAILSSVDDAIEKTQAVIDQVQVVKRGLMQELLTRGLPGRHSRFKQTEIGTIPEGWGMEPLGTLVQNGTSVTYGIVQAGPHVEHGVPYIKTGDMTADGIRLDGLARTHPNIAANYKRSEVRSGDLVFAIRASVGMVAEVPPQLDGANLTQGTARISPSERVTSRYLLWALRGVAIQKWVALRTKGTTYSEITLKTLRDVPIPVPTIDEQGTNRVDW